MIDPPVVPLPVAPGGRTKSVPKGRRSVASAVGEVAIDVAVVAQRIHDRALTLAQRSPIELREIVGTARETGLPESDFPKTAPYRFEEAADDGFWPG